MRSGNGCGLFCRLAMDVVAGGGIIGRFPFRRSATFSTADLSSPAECMFVGDSRWAWMSRSSTGRLLTRTWTSRSANRMFRVGSALPLTHYTRGPFLLRGPAGKGPYDSPRLACAVCHDARLILLLAALKPGRPMGGG